MRAGGTVQRKLLWPAAIAVGLGVLLLATWWLYDAGKLRGAIELESLRVLAPGGASWRFELDSEAKQMLLEGLDAIDLTLRQRGAIERFLERDAAERPWIYLEPAAGGGT